MSTCPKSDQAVLDGFARVTIPVNTVMFSGSSDSTATCPHPFSYVGQLGKTGSILYAASNKKTAEGYAAARCGAGTAGWVKKYKIHTPLSLVDISPGFTHYEFDEVMACLCATGENGYMLNWGDGTIEYAICNPDVFLTFKGAKPCLGHATFGDYTCYDGVRTKFSQEPL